VAYTFSGERGLVTDPTSTVQRQQNQPQSAELLKQTQQSTVSSQPLLGLGDLFPTTRRCSTQQPTCQPLPQLNIHTLSAPYP
jgi:hypothetical protein